MPARCPMTASRARGSLRLKSMHPNFTSISGEFRTANEASIPTSCITEPYEPYVEPLTAIMGPCPVLFFISGLHCGGIEAHCPAIQSQEFSHRADGKETTAGICSTPAWEPGKETGCGRRKRFAFLSSYSTTAETEIVPRVETEREKTAPEISGLRIFRDESI